MYLILPSNSGDFSSNNTSSYRVKLPNTLSFKGAWEVALTEIQYPVSWNTVKTTKGQFTVVYVHNDMKIPLKIRIQPGYYNTIDGLQHAINHAIEEEGRKLPSKLYMADFALHRLWKLKENDRPAFDKFEKHGYSMADMYARPELVPKPPEMAPKTKKKEKDLQRLIQNVAKSDELRRNPPKRNMLSDILKISYSKNQQRVKVHWLTESIKEIKFDDSLQFMLGFNKNRLLKPGINTADYNEDISGAENTFFVYCNIVQPQYVGNSLIPLLRTVPVNLETLGATGHKEFTAPHYIGVLCNEFDTIQIEVRNDSGDLIDFQFGKVIVKLHLRQKLLLNL